MSLKRENSVPIFTDTWHPAVEGEEVPEGDLFPGELSAVFFRVGCYTLRSAMRVYKVHNPDGSKGQGRKIPAELAEVELVRKDNYYKTFIEPVISGDIPAAAEYPALTTVIQPPVWRYELCVVHEISAKYNKSAGSGFVHICSAMQYINIRDPEDMAKRSLMPEVSGCYEYIGDIYTFKAQESFPDENASLLIYKHCESSRQGVDTWYRFDPSGKLASSREIPFEWQEGVDSL